MREFLTFYLTITRTLFTYFVTFEALISTFFKGLKTKLCMHNQKKVESGLYLKLFATRVLKSNFFYVETSDTALLSITFKAFVSLEHLWNAYFLTKLSNERRPRICAAPPKQNTFPVWRDALKFFKSYLPQNLLNPLLNTWSHIFHYQIFSVFSIINNFAQFKLVILFFIIISSLKK